MDENLRLVFKIYERKLSDMLTSQDFNDLQQKCFRMLQINGIEKADPGDWKDFMTDIVKPTEEEIKEYKEITKGWC